MARSLGVARLTATSIVDRQQVGGSWQTVGSFEVVAKAICKTCNGEWLAQEENRVKPYLEPILHGKRERLDEASREWLAAWIWKTFLVMDTLYKPRTFTVGDAERFLKYRVPPRKDAWILIGRIKPGPNLSTGGRAITPIVTSVTGKEEGNASVWTVKVGSFVAQAIHLVRGPECPRLSFVIRPDRFASKLSSIWPPAGEVHGSIPLEPDDFHELALRLRGSSRCGWMKS